MTTVDYMMEADNVYRTKNYIVCQKVSLCRSGEGNTLILSQDTYLLRTYNLKTNKAKTTSTQSRLFFLLRCRIICTGITLLM